MTCFKNRNENWYFRICWRFAIFPSSTIFFGFLLSNAFWIVEYCVRFVHIDFCIHICCPCLCFVLRTHNLLSYRNISFSLYFSHCCRPSDPPFISLPISFFICYISFFVSVRNFYCFIIAIGARALLSTNISRSILHSFSSNAWW